MNNAVFLFTVFALAISSINGLPNCSKETNDNCLGEGADFTPEGVKKCLDGLTEKSEDCVQYLNLMEKCADDLKGEGACASDNLNGNAMPCLLQRVDASKLSAGCQAALPAPATKPQAKTGPSPAKTGPSPDPTPAKELKGLNKFWKDGKRELTDEEIAQLADKEDKATGTRNEAEFYKKWLHHKIKKATIKARDLTRAKRTLAAKAGNHITEFMAGGRDEKTIRKHGEKFIAKHSKKHYQKGKFKFTKEQREQMLEDAIKIAKHRLSKRDL